MPIWVIVYLLAYTALAVNGVWSNRQDASRLFLVGSAMDSLVLLWLGCSYWYPAMISHVSLIGRPLLLGLLLWLPYSIKSNIRLTLEKEPATKSTKPCTLCIGVFATLYILLVSGPLYYWAIMHIVFAKYASS